MSLLASFIILFLCMATPQPAGIIKTLLLIAYMNDSIRQDPNSQTYGLLDKKTLATNPKDLNSNPGIHMVK